MGNAITELINQTTQELKAKKNAEESQLQNQFEAEVEKLKPMLKMLQEGLIPFGLNPKLHTDKKHYPCPAIHIKGNNVGWDLSHEISEIFLTSQEGKKWKSGACNTHSYSFENDEELINFVVKSVSKSLV